MSCLSGAIQWWLIRVRLAILPRSWVPLAKTDTIDAAVIAELAQCVRALPRALKDEHPKLLAPVNDAPGANRRHAGGREDPAPPGHHYPIARTLPSISTYWRSMRRISIRTFTELFAKAPCGANRMTSCRVLKASAPRCLHRSDSAGRCV